MAFQKILCPLDFSEASLKGVERAKEIAKEFQSEVILLFVAEPITYMPLMGHAVELIGEIEEEIEKQAKEKFEELLPTFDGKVSYQIRRGPAPQEIIKTAEEEKVDLIVIGTHSRRGIPRLILGSTAEKVVRRAPCDVMVVRGQGR